MNLLFYVLLFIFGTLFGSFASVLVYRIKSGEGGIMAGRSHCPRCQHTLSALELIPLFSWIFQKGKCKVCKTKISPIYPALETVTGTLFLAVGYFIISPELIFGGDIFEIIRLIFFLTIIFLTIVYSFYDILFLEIPERILLTANILVFAALIFQDAGWRFLEHIGYSNLDYGVSSGSTIVLCLLVLGLLYYVMLAGLKELYDCLIVGFCVLLLGGYVYRTGLLYLDSSLLSGTIAAVGIYVSFFVQIIVSQGRWMGAGDLRIAVLMGLLVGYSFAFPAWMLCYIIGSILGIIILVQARVKKSRETGFETQVPFGPFIASGYLCVLFFHPQISSFIAWYL